MDRRERPLKGRRREAAAERSRSGWALGIVAAVTVLTGCGILDPTICTTEARPALRVQVLDSASLEPVRGDLQVVARVGTLADTVDTQQRSVPPSVDRDTVVFGPFGLAHERAGTYEVSVEAPDYAPWQRSGVQVGEGGCHVQTVDLSALLQRADG